MSAEARGDPGQMGRVLVVDDDRYVGEMLRDFLAGLGYAVKNARTGEDALQLADVFLPEVVLLDITLPAMTGLELLDCLRTAYPSTRVIMLSGHHDVELAKSCLARGAFDCVAKPMNLADLARLVAIAMAARGAA
jgi:two-component system, NtrC family, sensor kinase